MSMITCLPTFAAPPTQLFLFGGGNKSTVALQKWIDAAPDVDSHFLLIHWGTDYPVQTCQDFIDSIQKTAPVKIICAPTREWMDRDVKPFMSVLKRAKGIFFSGGDQNKIMKVFNDHPEIRSAIHSAYHQGIPVAGTSAGTAIQSQTMITGESGGGVQTTQGLGLIQNVILDQHFIKRNREARLKEALIKNPEILGLGVDEDAALEIINGRWARPITGPSVFIRETKNSFWVQTLTDGDQVDLATN
jgi:cyanophycinase